MRKSISVLFLTIVLTSTLLGKLYFCAYGDCATWIIEDSEGFSWYVECMDGTTQSGRVNGAGYSGNCEEVN